MTLPVQQNTPAQFNDPRDQLDFNSPIPYTESRVKGRLFVQAFEYLKKVLEESRPIKTTAHALFGHYDKNGLDNQLGIITLDNAFDSEVSLQNAVQFLRSYVVNWKPHATCVSVHKSRIQYPLEITTKKIGNL